MRELLLFSAAGVRPCARNKFDVECGGVRPVRREVCNSKLETYVKSRKKISIYMRAKFLMSFL